MSDVPVQVASQREGKREQQLRGESGSTSGQGAASALARMKLQYEHHASERPADEPDGAGVQHEAR